MCVSSFKNGEFVSNKAKGRISKRVFQEHKAHQIFRKMNISNPLIRTRTCAYQGVRNVRFSENLACFVFLKHPFWDSPFCFITVELKMRLWRIVALKRKQNAFYVTFILSKKYFAGLYFISIYIVWVLVGNGLSKNLTTMVGWWGDFFKSYYLIGLQISAKHKLVNKINDSKHILTFKNVL